MARQSNFTPAYALRTLGAWGVALLLFFPLGWLLLTAFKTELQAIAIPPELFFTPTLESFAEVNSRSDYLLHARNSVVTSVLTRYWSFDNRPAPFRADSTYSVNSAPI